MNTSGLMKLSKRTFMAFGPDGSLVGKLRVGGPVGKIGGDVVATIPDGSLEGHFLTLQMGRKALIEIACHQAIGNVIKNSWARLEAAPVKKPARRRRVAKQV